MKPVDWKQINYLRVIAIALWSEFQIYLIFLLLSKPGTLSLWVRVLLWQVSFLLFILRATREASAPRSYSRGPARGMKPFLLKAFVILVASLLILSFAFISYTSIEHFLPNAKDRTLVWLHFLGFSSAIALAWAISEHLQHFLFGCLDKPDRR